MKTKLLLLIFFFASLKDYAQTWQWTHPEPNGNAAYPNDNDYAQKLVTDNSGNVYELGQYSGDLYLTNVYRASGHGSFIAKYNSSGKLLWYKLIYTVSAGGTITGGDIVITDNQIFLTTNFATTNYDQYHCQAESHYTYSIGSYTFSTAAGDMGISFASFDLNGNVVWNKKANAYRSNTCSNGGKVDYAPLLSTDKNGNIVLTFSSFTYDGLGFTFGSDFISVGYISGPYGCQNVIAIKYNTSGDFVWSNYSYPKKGGPNSEKVKSVTCDNDGNIFINCRLNDSTCFGNLIFHTRSNLTNYYGDTTAFASSVLIKISSSGTWKFVKEIASSTSEVDENRNQNLAADSFNNVYIIVSANGGVVLGDTISTSRMFIVKFKNNGGVLWKKVFGNPVEPINTGPYNSGFVINNDKLYISGAIRNLGSPAFLFSNLKVPNTSCSSDENYQYFVAKADTSGQFKWATLVCGNANMMAHSLAVFSDNVYTCGEYRVSVNSLGNLNGTFVNQDFNATNMFLGKLKDQYIKVGAVIPTTLCPGGDMSILFTSYGLTFSGNNKFTAEISNADGDFTTPTIIGSTASTSTGSITATIPTTLSYGSGYVVRIKSSDTLKTGYNYYAYADTDYKITLLCPAPSALTNTNITSSSTTLNWHTVDCAKGYRLKYKVNTASTWTTINITSNTGTYNLTGLAANTTYQWKVATKCKPGSIAYYSKDAGMYMFTTSAVGFAIADMKAEQLKTSSMTVYPNPANNTAIIIFNTTKTGKYTLELTDISAKVLERKNGEVVSGENKIILDISKYAQGIYLVNLTDGENGKRTLKLNKQ